MTTLIPENSGLPVFLQDQPELTYEITYGFISILKYLANLKTYRWTLLCIIPFPELVLRVFVRRFTKQSNKLAVLKKFTGDLKACVVQIKVVCDRNTRKRTISLIFEWILGQEQSLGIQQYPSTFHSPNGSTSHQ